VGLVAVGAIGVGLAAQGVGCSSSDAPAAHPSGGAATSSPGTSPSSEAGTLSLALTLPGGEMLNLVSWIVTDASGNPVQSGNVPVTNSLSIAFTIGGLAPAPNYTITISAAATNGGVTCTGAAQFGITARTTTIVTDLLQCNAPLSEAGSAAINASTYNCAAIASVSESPSEVTVGGSVSFSATATGASAPGVTYGWSAPSGSFSAPAAASTTFTCNGAGTVPVTLTVGDGNVPEGGSCNPALTTQVFQVQCDPNNCGVLSSLTAGPNGTETFVGESLVLTATATGPNPNNLGYTWTMSNPIGAFGSTTGGVGAQGQDEAWGPTDVEQFMCTAPGTATITVVVDDGPTGAGSCPTNLTTLTTSVVCDAAPSTRVAAAWVELTGPNGLNGYTGNVAIARAITETAPAGAGANPCPTITINGGTPVQMNLRAAATTSIPARTVNTAPGITAAAIIGGAAAGGPGKPALFPVSACEYPLPSGTTSAVVAGQSLPVPKANPTKIVVIGDTGCRLQTDNGAQSCNDPNPNGTDTPYPFAAVAALAAAQNPDLVLHVGDYAYRDNECPAGLGFNCGGSPWGFGWDTWQADLFAPGAPLLAAAPWIMTRGNHEQCNRAGQGWYRFLDSQPFDTADVHTCDNAAYDDPGTSSTATTVNASCTNYGVYGNCTGNWNNPFVVQINSSTQIVVFDTANAKPQSQAVNSAFAILPTSSSSLPTGSSSLFFSTYASELSTAGSLVSASPLPFNFWSNHHPIFGYATGSAPTNPIPAFVPVMNSVFPGTYFPAPINLALHGHTHDYQAINFQTGHLPDGGTFQPAATLVSGNAGDVLDTALPYPLTGSSVSAVGNPTAVSVANPDGGAQQFSSSDNGTPYQNPISAAAAAAGDSPTDNDFGYMVLQFNAGPPATWTSTEYRTDNTVRDICTMQTSGQMSCASWGIIPPDDAGTY
jgi:hypothetical protein